MTDGIVLGISLVSTITPQSRAAVVLAFHQPAAYQIRSETSAGRQKKEWGRAGKRLVMDLVAKGVAREVK